jgi:hypothetical protein
MAILDARIVVRGFDEFDSDIAELALMELATKQEEDFLDVVHALLQKRLGYEYQDDLEALLKTGGSVWCQRDGGLILRVDEVSQQAFDGVGARVDNASAELREAWSLAYGRNPDASDAWDHAIKAVEAALSPVVMPNETKPTLGKIIGHLSATNHRNRPLWKLGIPGPNNDYSIEPLIHILGLLWPNPDRHGNAAPPRTPTLEEAKGVVHLAVTVVQWTRDGQISRR